MAVLPLPLLLFERKTTVGRVVAAGCVGSKR